ncbi:replication initiator [Streptomyces sparsogenes]|uniref:replication initiator n=1 Tax=Streptomyces sparsogenes TaxID=67365 RepID=UPI003F4D3B68
MVAHLPDFDRVHDQISRVRGCTRPVRLKAAEYQRCGLVHCHAVIRLDGPEGSNQAPPAWATTDALTHAIKEATGRAVLTIACASLLAAMDVHRASRCRSSGTPR